MSDSISERRRVTEALYRERFEGDLAERVALDREAGKSWRTIRDELMIATAGDIRLTDVTLMQWYGPADSEAVA